MSFNYLKTCCFFWGLVACAIGARDRFRMWLGSYRFRPVKELESEVEPGFLSAFV
jgi:hypothetical protein